MADFKLGRLKFVWKGGWTTAIAYVKDDIVEYNGQGWVCEVPHTSAGFPADRDSGKWTKMAEGFSWNGEWDSATTYQENAVVSYLSSTWISISDNNTNNPPLVLPATVDANWQLYAAGYDLSYVDQDILPSADGLYDIGSPSLRFKDLYMTGNSIFLGPAKIESDGNSVTITNGDGTQVIFADGGFAGGDVVFQGNTVTTVDSNANLELDAAGTGKVVALTNMDIIGNLDVTGDITLGGNLIIGDTPVDTVTVQADFTSDLIPNASNSFDLGSTGQRWDNLYINKINDLSFDKVEGNTYYVTQDGDDLDSGTSIQGAFATIKKALTVATAGDTIKVGAGTFTEVFPLTVPAGVSIVGLGIRPTKIIPTVGTNNKDAFLLEGESGIVDLTIADFFYDAINDTGYAFRFKNSAVITTRSPYIERVTVLCRGSSPSASDPYGYLTGDAGRGAEVDGAKVTRASLEAAMLFNECTFIVPNSRALIMKNGARVEWLTCFTYFADLAIEGVVGATGRGGDGKTYITLSNIAGTWNVGNTLSYYANDGVTVLASGVIETVNGSTFQLDGSVSGFITNTNRNNKPITVNGDAKLSDLQEKFGLSSLLLDGTGDYLSLASNSDFGYGTGDFTIEMQVYRSASGVTQILIDQRTAAPTNYAPLIFINASNQVVYSDGANTVITGATTVPLNAWSHIAVSRSGTSTRLFLDGVQQGTTYTDTRNYIATPIIIGARFDGIQSFFTGHIDELRITKGLARYTAAFTPPVAAFAGDSSTVLLLHFDGTNLSTNIVDDGITIQDVRSSGSGTATGITRYDRKEFAAELRSISSANIYGNQGAKADGADVKLQLMAHNFAYIGTGADLTNNDTAVIQANEVIEVNGGNVYYNSVDQSGNFRVGEFFSVDFETGAVTFAAGNFDVSSLAGINFTDGANTTIVDPTQVTTGNLTLAGNTLTSSTGNITIDPSGNDDIILNADVNITGNLDVGGNITLAGNIQIGDTTLDTVTVVADFTSNLIPDADQTYDLGSSAKQWRTIHVDQLDNGQVSVKDNRIQTIVSNSNLELDAAGTGSVSLLTDVTTPLTTFNLLDTTATTVNFAGAATTVDIGAATGTLTINNNKTVLNSTGTLQVPVGNNSQRGSGAIGEIRFNNELSSFEGYAGTAWGSLGGVRSIDGFTYIVPETSPGASNGELEFYAEDAAGTGSVKVAGLNRTRLTVPIATASTATTDGALVVSGGVGIGGVVNIGSNLNVTGDVAVNGGDLTTNQTTFNLLNTTATTLNVGGAATTVAIGATTGTTTVRNNLTVTGDFTVNGTTTTVNSTTLSVDDKNIELASIASPTDVTADGAGITIKGTTDKTFNWVDATNSFTANQNIDVLAGNALKVAGDDKVTATALFPNGDVTIGSSFSTVTINDEILINNFLITNGDVISDNPTQNLYPDGVGTIVFGHEATSISMGDLSGQGTVKINNNLDVIENLRVGGNTIAARPSTIVFASIIGNFNIAGQNGFTTTTDGMDAQVEVEFERDTGILQRVTLLSGGKGWVPNDTLYIRGSELGGLDGNDLGVQPITGNDIVLTVTAVNTPKVLDGNGDPVDNTGVITQFDFEGTPPVIDGGLTTFSLLENFVEAVGFATSATTITIGAIDGLGQPNGSTNIRHNLQVNGNLTVNSLFTGAVGTLDTNALEMNLFDDTVTTINFGGEADNISIGSGFGETLVNNELRVPSGIIADLKGSVFGDFSSKIVDGITGDIIANDLQVNGSATFEFDILVKGGDIVTNQTTFNLINDTATILNIGQAATGISMGAETGTFTIRNANTQLDGDVDIAGGNITTGASVFNIANSGAIELAMGGSAQTVSIGSGLGTTTVNNALVVKLNATIEGTDLNTTNTTFNLVNTIAETVNFAGDATVINVGNNTGTTVLNSAITEVIGDLKVQGGDLITDAASFNLLQTPTTVNFADAATTLQIAAGSGTTTIRNDVVVSGDLAVTGGDITSSAATFNLLNAGPGTINLGGAASTVNIGFTNGATNIRHNANIFGVLTVGSADSTVSTIESADTSFYLANTTAENLYMGGAATVVEIGSTTGTTTINNDLAVDGAATFEQDVLVKGGDLTTNQSTFNLINTTASTINLGGAATTVNVGSADGNTVVKNNLQVDKDVEIRGGDLTTNQATFNLINGNATTVNFAGGANTVNIAAPGSDTNIAGELNVTGITNVSNHILPTANIAYDLGSSTNRFRDLYLSGGTIDLAGGTISFDGTSFNFQGGTNVGQSVDTDSQSFDLLNSIATTINFGGDATTINLGALSGSTNIRNNLAVAGQITLGSSDSSTSTLDVTDTSFFLANSTAETIFFGGAATSINMGAVGGTTTLNTAITVSGNTLLESDLTVNGNLTLTSLNTTGENNDFVISPQGTGRVIIEPQGGLIITPGTTGEVNNVNIGFSQRGTAAFTTLAANGQTLFSAGISSTDSTTGSVVVQGGIGVGENLNVEGNISANALTLRGTVLFDNELAVPSGGTGAGQFTTRGILYGNSTAPIQSTAASDHLNQYTGTNQQTSNAILTTDSQGVPVWTDVIDCGTF
jgi:Concanavalin A-like lectin/glucanases superfamily